MKFWDSSSIIPLLIKEKKSGQYTRVLKADQGRMAVWWGSSMECVSAIMRKVREGNLSDRDAASAVLRLDMLRDAWVEVEPSESVRKWSLRLLRNHDIGAADSLQLAAAWVLVGEGDPSGLKFLTDDDRLKKAAMRDGFLVSE